MPHAQVEAYSTPEEYAQWLRNALIIKPIGSYQHISTRKREQMLKMGVEYEFSGQRTRITCDDFARNVIAQWANIGINVKSVYDGSLGDSGRELVFPPMTESAYKALAFMFTKMFQGAIGYGFSDIENRSGAHLHISLKSFGNAIPTRRNNIRRLVEWFYNNKAAIEKYAMRSSQYALFEDWSEHYQENYRDRYRAVNLLTGYNHSLNGAKTVEIRVFSGLRSTTQLLANVQLMKIIVNTLNGSNAKVLENYDLNALILANRRNAPDAFEHWLAVSVGR